MSTTKPIVIQTHDELLAFMQQHGIASDWRNISEKNITATVEGNDFANTGAWPLAHYPDVPRDLIEMYVTLRRVHYVGNHTTKGKALAYVNLLTLFSWATSPIVIATVGVDVMERTTRSMIQSEINNIAVEYENSEQNKSLGRIIGEIVRDVGRRINARK